MILIKPQTPRMPSFLETHNAIILEARGPFTQSLSACFVQKRLGRPAPHQQRFEEASHLEDHVAGTPRKPRIWKSMRRERLCLGSEQYDAQSVMALSLKKTLTVATVGGCLARAEHNSSMFLRCSTMLPMMEMALLPSMTLASAANCAPVIARSVILKGVPWFLHAQAEAAPLRQIWLSEYHRLSEPRSNNHGFWYVQLPFVA